MPYASIEPLRRPLLLAAFAVSLLVVLASCGGDSNSTDGVDSNGETTETQAPTADTGDSGGNSNDGSAHDSGDAPVLQGGNASFAIDGETYSFDSFVCAFGYDATQEEGMFFAAAGEGTSNDGTPIQIAVQLYDDGLREGLRQVQFLRMGDSGDFEFSWTLSDTEPLSVEDPTGRAVVVLEDDSLVIQGGMYDRIEGQAETGEQAEGSFDGVCSPDSLR